MRAQELLDRLNAADDCLDRGGYVRARRLIAGGEFDDLDERNHCSKCRSFLMFKDCCEARLCPACMRAIKHLIPRRPQ